MLTDITLILDRSLSMFRAQRSAILGFNRFLEQQANLSGKAVITLVQFDAKYDVKYQVQPIEQAPRLTLETYHLGQGTALLDALGYSITATRDRLNGLAPAARPDAVLIVVLTDGEENSSRHFDIPQIQQLVAHHREHDHWQFGFLGANQDSCRTAGSLGMDVSSALDFTASDEGTLDAFNSLDNSLRRFREGGNSRGIWRIDSDPG